MANSDWTFKIKESEYVKYSSAASSQTLDEDLCAKYSEEAIEKAKQLKAKHGTAYSDAYYLDYAKSLELQELIAANREIHKRRVVKCEIKDVEWAGYSYEEILAMEANGHIIPEEILQWAHAQQQSDVTDYVMVSDATALEDNTTEASGDPQDELSNLQTKAKQNIAKTEIAFEEAAINIEEFKLNADKAEEIQKKQNSFYKAMLDEISKDKQEYERLCEKKESGKISKFEELKLKKLSKKFNDKDNGLVNKIQENSKELETFLSSLDGLNEDISENLTLARDTIKSGKELGEYEKTYNESQLPVATEGAIFDGNGKSSDTLYDVKGEEISELAIEKGSELEEFSNSLSAELSSGDNAKLTEFATDYTTRAAELQDDQNENKKDGENSGKENQDPKSKVRNYDVMMNFSLPNSIIATATTLLSTNDLIARDINVTRFDKQLKTDLKTAQKDAKELSSEKTKAEEKLTENQAKEEETITELEALGEKAPAAKTQKTRAEEQIPVENSEQPTDEKTVQKQALTNELAQTQNETKSFKDLVKKATAKSATTTLKGEKLAKTLQGHNNNLETRNKNNENVSDKTIAIGTGTVAKGFVDTALGTSLYSTGLSLIPFPPTFSQGVALTILGIELQLLGQNEIAYGTIAMGTGLAGNIASAVATDTNKDATSTLKEAEQVYKFNNQEIKEASQSIGEENPVGETKSGEATQDSTETQETSTQSEETKISDETIETTTETDQTTPAEENLAETPEIEQNPETNENTEVENTEGENPETNPENGEQEETTANQTQQKAQEKQPSVDMEFSAPNAINATATTVKTTADMVKEERQMHQLSRNVEVQTKESKTLIKNIDKETAKAAVQHQANLAESEAISAQHALAQNDAQTAQTEDQVLTAQDKMVNLSTQLDSTIQRDETSTASADKTVSESVQKLAKFRNNTKIMDQELPALNKTISNQLDVSAKTMAVGIGTTGVGVLNSYTGTGLMLSGMILMSNPFTYGIGVTQLLAGEILLSKGLAEIGTGTVAAATGSTGIVANAITRAVSNDSDEVLEEANEQNEELEEKAGISEDELNGEEITDETSDPTTEEPETIAETEQPQAVEQEENEFLASITQLSASASANANVIESTLTDDKADRKLSRFNTESIIESKKKMKKVQAVSASSGGKA
ncbi:hypothetical protein IKL64_05960 [bacterium]|nr:hypothetical protein [bacterium]